MREILFRAKSVDYGEWKVGGIYQEPKNDIKEGLVYIISGSLTSLGNGWVVDPSTVGEYTGVTDRIGNKIFEGDILMTGYGPGELRWHDRGLAGWVIEFFDKRLLLQSGRDYEVIGNIYESKELLNEPHERTLV